jgi:hypothetical protein
MNRARTTPSYNIIACILEASVYGKSYLQLIKITRSPTRHNAMDFRSVIRLKILYSRLTILYMVFIDRFSSHISSRCGLISKNIFVYSLRPQPGLDLKLLISAHWASPKLILKIWKRGE